MTDSSSTLKHGFQQLVPVLNHSNRQTNPSQLHRYAQLWQSNGEICKPHGRPHRAWLPHINQAKSPTFLICLGVVVVAGCREHPLYTAMSLSPRCLSHWSCTCGYCIDTRADDVILPLAQPVTFAGSGAPPLSYPHPHPPTAHTHTAAGRILNPKPPHGERRYRCRRRLRRNQTFVADICAEPILIFLRCGQLASDSLQIRFGQSFRQPATVGTATIREKSGRILITFPSRYSWMSRVDSCPCQAARWYGSTGQCLAQWPGIYRTRVTHELSSWPDAHETLVP